MIPSIPSYMLSHTIQVKTPSSVDADHNAVYTTQTVRHVCVQTCSKTKMTGSNTSVELHALAFVDIRLSRPHLDWMGLKRQADAVGGNLQLMDDCAWYTVHSVTACQDDRGRIHHYELELI